MTGACRLGAVEQVFLDEYGLCTGANIRWGNKIRSAYRVPLDASYKVEIESQKD